MTYLATAQQANMAYDSETRPACELLATYTTSDYT